MASTGTGPYPTGKAVEGNTLDALLGPVNMMMKVSAISSINVNNIISSTIIMMIILIHDYKECISFMKPVVQHQ